MGHTVQYFGSTMQAWTNAFQTAKVKAAAEKAAQDEKGIEDKHAGSGALGAGQQMMQAAADEDKKRKQEEKNEKHRQLERTKQEDTTYVNELMVEMTRLHFDADVEMALKKNEEIISKCLAQAGVFLGKKDKPAAKGSQGPLPHKLVALEGHNAILVVSAKQYIEETWPQRTSAVMSISHKAGQLSFIITALKKNSLLSAAMITKFLATLGLSPSDPTIRSVAELKWNRNAQGALAPQYNVTLGTEIEWPLAFVKALSRGPNVALVGNDGVVEEAVWRITGGAQVALKIDDAHLKTAGAMTKILDVVGTEQYVFEEAIANSLSAKWVELGGQRTEVLGAHFEKARKDNRKGGVWTALSWKDVHLPKDKGGPRLFATVQGTEVAESMENKALTFTVLLGKNSEDCSLRFEVSIAKKSGVGGQTMDFSTGYENALARAQKAKDTGKKKSLQLLDDLI